MDFNFPFIILLIISVALTFIVLYSYSFIDKLKRQLHNVRAEVNSYGVAVGKLVNVTYISELDKLNITNIDNNICTIINPTKLSKTAIIHLFSQVCSSLNIEIEHIRLNDNIYLACLKKDFFSTVSIDGARITLTSQSFEFLLLLRETISNLLNTEILSESIQ